MKKRIISFILVILVVFSLASCSAGGDTYDFEKATVTSVLSGTSVDMESTFEFVYDDTKLRISDDGDWAIEQNFLLFITINIDEGTYEMNGDTYVFDGFEYGMNAYGVKTDEGFEIDFYLSGDLAATLFFED